MVLLISRVSPLEAVMLVARRAPERLVLPPEFRLIERVLLVPIAAELLRDDSVFRAMAAPRMAEPSERLRSPVDLSEIKFVSVLPMVLLISRVLPLEAVMTVARRAPERLVSSPDLRLIELVSLVPIAAELLRDDSVFRAMLVPCIFELSDRLRLPWAVREMFCVLALPMVLLISRVSPLEAVMFVARRAPERLVSSPDLRLIELVLLVPIVAALLRDLLALRAMLVPYMDTPEYRSRAEPEDKERSWVWLEPKIEPELRSIPWLAPKAI